MRLSRQYSRVIDQGPRSGDQANVPGPPYANGWFALAFADELKPGTVLTRRFMGDDVVLYRLRSGGVRATRPYCPHLGAHLGVATVHGDELVCPFHNFAFGPDGTCVRNGYNTQPPKASLEQLPVLEVNDAVFVWRHHDGRAPDWEIPAWQTVAKLPMRHVTWEMGGNAQDVMENSVDIGHFGTLHGWLRAQLGGPVTYQGNTFHVSMLVREYAPVVGEFDVTVDVDGYGLSCLNVDIFSPRFGLHMYTQVMPTAITPNRMQLRQGNRIALDQPGWLPPSLAPTLTRLATRLLQRPLFRSSCDFTAADFPIWGNKTYLQHPRLCQGDGPIGQFRRWARQFHDPVEEDGRGGGQQLGGAIDAVESLDRPAPERVHSSGG